MLRLVHAVVSGVALALVLGLVLIPSLTVVASVQLGAQQRDLSITKEGTGAYNTTDTSPTAKAEVLGQPPTMALGVSLLAIALVLLSFLVVGRLSEGVPEKT